MSFIDIYTVQESLDDILNKLSSCYINLITSVQQEPWLSWIMRLAF